MSSTLLFEASVPVLTRYLGQLLLMLDRAEDCARARQLGDATLLRQGLTPGMFDLGQQVQIAAGFALRCMAPLIGRALPALGEGDAQDFAALRRRVAQAQALLGTLGPDDLVLGDEDPVQTQAGEAALSMPAREFVLGYAMPNFFFHLCMAYALLRAQGVPLGKPDFDGWHRYAPGFSFV